MSGSLKLLRVFNIELKVHWSFLLILLIAVLNGAGSPAGVAFSLGLVLLLFVCVTLHEFGHALTAQRFGIPVREIILLPIGGVAVMNRIPEKPAQELLIAAAGPLVNVGILCVLVPLWLGLGGSPAHLWPPPDLVRHGSVSALMLTTWLIYGNLLLIGFNLIPAFPMDGGRMFRALLATQMPFARATRIAARVGQVAAVGMALWALTAPNILMLVIAFFIFMNAGAESAAAQAGTVLATRRVGDAYNKTAIELTIDHRVSHVIEHLLTSYQPDYAVLNKGRLVGVVTRSAILRWLAESPSLYDVYVTEVMTEEQNVLKLQSNLTLDDVVNAMTDANVNVVAVYEGDHYLGLVNQDDLDEAQAVLTFLNRRLSQGAAPMRSPWPVPVPSTPRRENG